MKIETEDQEPKFSPIKITLLVESEEELCDLWHRMNVGGGLIGKVYNNTYLKHGVMETNYEEDSFYLSLDRLVESRNLQA